MSASGSSCVRQQIPMQNRYDRIILLIDMDCFYCQVEEKLNPKLKGQPVAVVQYNAWRGGGIIAVNYAARAKGVSRHMRGDEAKNQCPEIQLVKVPSVREKADLSKYRDAGKEVANVMQQFTNSLERASIDESYLDITAAVNERLDNIDIGSFILQPEQLQDTFAVGYNHIGEYVIKATARFVDHGIEDETFHVAHDVIDVNAVKRSDLRLIVGASIANEIRAAVKSATGYECSAGIAHNKMLAKLVCGLNKPNKQTILPLVEIPKFFETLPVGKIKGMGGKFGEDVCERLGVRYMGELTKFTESELQKKFDEKNGTWLYNICRGIDLEAVIQRFYSKSIGCCKNFPGRNCINGLSSLKHWLHELSSEIVERLDKDMQENNRKAKQMVVSFIQELNGEDISSSRSMPLSSYDRELLTKQSLDVIKNNTKQFFRTGSESVLNNPIKFLGISVGKFETINTGQSKLQEMFANQVAKCATRNTQPATEIMKSTSEEKKEEQRQEKNNSEINAEKPKSFLINYLQSQQESNTRKVKLEEQKSESAKEDFQKSGIESFFNNYNAKHVNQVQNVTSTPQAARNLPPKAPPKSFFISALLKQQAAKKERCDLNTVNTELPQVTLFELDEQVQREQTTLQADEIIAESEKYAENWEILPTQNEEGSEFNKDLVDNGLGGPKRKLINCTDTSPNRATNLDTEMETFPSYEDTYAEFAVPELSADLLDYVKCEECGKNILDDSRCVQTHRDYHFAQKLSQQQRIEYRAELKPKVNVTKVPNSQLLNTTTSSTMNNKSKKPKVSSVTPKVDITKFLKPTLDQRQNLCLEPSTSAEAAKELETCEKCQAQMRSCEMVMHMDFHIARELQKELNQLPTSEIKKNASEKPTSKSSNNKLSNSTVKPITQFFTQPKG